MKKYIPYRFHVILNFDYKNRTYSMKIFVNILSGKYKESLKERVRRIAIKSLLETYPDAVNITTSIERLANVGFSFL